MSARTDWVGVWFKILEQRGEFTGIRFGRIAEGGAEWRFLPHEHFDGIGGLAHLLREAGIPFEGVPQARGFGDPGLWAKLAAFRRFSTLDRPRPAMWRAQDVNWAQVPGRAAAAMPVGDAVAWKLFSREETSVLLARAREQGVSLNSLLLLALSRAVLPELVPGSGPVGWMIPVNMRGPVRRESDTANHASFIGVDLDPEWSAARVHARVLELLRENAQWGVWYAINVGRVLGERAVARAIEREHRLGASWVGSFSNLGAWSGGGDSSWLFCPPVGVRQPFGAGSVTWNGRLALTAQVHPSLRIAAGPVVERWASFLA